ncbi:MAG: WD40 repeat domain-containing protein [Arcobacteraceae bacterium]|nr:WD40 repeat domain-containing protein [Arcobacteraceae bacterium]
MNIIYKLLVVVFMIAHYSYAKDIKPTFILKSKGFVNDFVLDNTKLYVANDEGSVEIFDLQTQKLVGEIFIEPIFTTKQVWQNSKILSVDRQNGKTLIVSNDKGPFRNVWLHDGKNLKHIVKAEDKIAIKEARFIDDDKFIFGTLGYEMILHNTNDSYHTYKKQVEQSSFCDLELSEDKKTMITSSESGQVTLSDVKTGKIIKKYKPINLDKVYQVAYKNGNIITAGQDRKVAVYPKKGKSYYLKSKFLVYSVGLSPSGKTGIYSSSEDSDLQLFNIQTGKKINTLVGHYAIPTTIKFYDEKSLFSAGYEDKIFYWRID